MGKPKIKAIYGKVPDSSKTTKQINPESYFKEKPSWAFSRCDEDCIWWADLKNFWWSEIFPKLKAYENQTWADIFSTPKGRGEGSKSHFVPISRITKEAKDRLLSLNIYDDELFSLRFSGTERLWGFIIKGIFYIFWYDKNHAICPTA